MKTILLILITSLTSCIQIEKEGEEDVKSFDSTNKVSLESIQVQKSFNYQMQKEVRVEIINFEKTNFILYQVDENGKNSKVISRFNLESNGVINPRVPNKTTRLLLIATNSKGTMYYNGELIDNSVSFNI